MEKHTQFPALVAQIDAALGRSPNRLGLRYRNDENFERLCNAAATLYGELVRDPQRIVLGVAPELRQAIEQYERRYRDRIKAASHAALEVFLAELGEDLSKGIPDEAVPDEETESWVETFDERFHLPSAALRELADHCLGLAAFDSEEDPDAHQLLELAIGAIDYIEHDLRLDLDAAVHRRRSLRSYHVDAALKAENVRDWRRVDAYLHEAITAYVLGHNLAAIALARPVAEHVIRTVYVPVLLPEVHIDERAGLTGLIRKVQEAATASWLKAEEAVLVIESANKVLHYSHFDDMKTEGSLAVLARRILNFVRLLLLRAPMLGKT